MGAGDEGHGGLACVEEVPSEAEPTDAIEHPLTAGVVESAEASPLGRHRDAVDRPHEREDAPSAHRREMIEERLDVAAELVAVAGKDCFAAACDDAGVDGHRSGPAKNTARRRSVRPRSSVAGPLKRTAPRSRK